ncbi:MAG TPA: hypothetical protein VGQ21_17645 [Thermoanaerobaculia bacterium]|jgi:hypothetical protein|nr:hypothetical protein [Thermoanaerobaculia bacterium]
MHTVMAGMHEGDRQTRKKRSLLYLFAAGERLNSKKLLQLSEFTAAVNWTNQPQ